MFAIFLIIIVIVLLLIGALWLLVRTIIRLIPRAKPYSGLIAALVTILPPLCLVYSCLKGRSGEEIYEAISKSPKPDCVKIISHKDAHVPFIDNDILLYFHTCPQEMKRIISLNKYEVSKEATFFPSPITIDSSFHLTSMGDSVWIFKRPLGGGAVEIYMSLDSTQAYYFEADF